MSLFFCKKCKTIDNTATSGYWLRNNLEDDSLCSLCDKKIGKWHNLFPMTKYNIIFWKKNGKYIERRTFGLHIIKKIIAKIKLKLI